MKALLMAAGYGTRLEPLTKAVPKPLVLVVNKPIAQYNLELLQSSGFKDICMNIHYHPEQIENYFQQGDSLGIRLNYSYEEHLLGTAGGVKRMAGLMEVSSTFLVFSADGLTDINLGRLWAFHKKKKALATMALAEVEEVSEYGVVLLDEEERVVGFQEKPSPQEAASHWVNAGVYIFEPEILDLIPAGKPHDFGKELFPRLAKEKERFFGYKMIEYWQDIGTPEAYFRANRDVLGGRVLAKIGGRKVTKDLYLGRGTNVHKSALFEGLVFIGDRTDVGKNAKMVGTSVVGDMCIISHDVVIKDSVIWPDTYIGPGSYIEKSIIGSWCHLDANVHLAKESILGNRSFVQAGANLAAESKILPESKI